jgi:enamine deaminase RidA (YjgF/YER057c/UK114 family)
MTKIVKLKTGNKFEELGSYSRVVAVDDWIFVSNTAGRNSRSQEIPEDVGAQTRQVLANIQAALTAVGASLADVITSRVFIQNPEDGPKVLEIVGETFRGINPAATFTCPPLGSTIYKVEIEVSAYRGAGQAETEDRVISL